MLVAGCKTFRRLGAVIIVVGAALWWVALEWKWQEPIAERGLAYRWLQQPVSTPICGRVNDDVDASSECAPETGRIDYDGTAQATEPLIIHADTAESAGDKVFPEISQYIDVYDPLTWPIDANDSVDLPDVVPIDLYDPQTWPVETNQEADPAEVKSIDLYDSDTWPSSEAIRAESGSSAGEEGVDVYDASTWPETIGSAASGDAIVPIDPYDRNTWPEQ